ncbi:MAG: glycosyltransferase family 2 protein [Pyrinomonadaceae bacterium]
MNERESSGRAGRGGAARREVSGDDTLSLVVCTYRRPHEVERLLRAIAVQTRMPDEMLIVDGSPDDETERVVRKFIHESARGGGNAVSDLGSGLKYFRVPPAERGLTRQRNYGVERARGSFVSFLDDDTVPESDYFAETLACFARHPEACGVGGFITNEVEWRRADESVGKHDQSSDGDSDPTASSVVISVTASPRSRVPASVFRWGEWERREALRWRLRGALGLASELPPGWMPSEGHGRPVAYLPPDGGDYAVEFLMGCSFTFRREVFARHRFSSFFEGYGLYEDMDFCVRAAADAPLYLATRARLAHYHAPAGRPSRFRYGRMVVRNGWFVWRRRHPRPPLGARTRWWATTLLLALCELADVARGPRRTDALAEIAGRLWEMARLLHQTPEVESCRGPKAVEKWTVLSKNY